MKTKKAETAFDNSLMTWKAPEYIKFHKGVIWYTVFALFFMAGAWVSYLYSSWTFSMVLIIFAVVYLILDRKMPKSKRVVLSDVGIKVGDRAYQYSRIKAFWVVYNPPFSRTLYIRVHKDYMVDIEIQLGDQDPGEVVAFLSKRLPEMEGKEEGLLIHISRLLKL